MEYLSSMLAVRLPQDQHAKLRVLAETEEISMSDLVRELIEDRLGEVK